MGRETKILLGLLGLLAGAFMGVLSMKLLVPRPPAGAGPDVHHELAAAPPHDLVDPPARSFHPGAFAAAPPLGPAPARTAPADDGAAVRVAGGPPPFEPPRPERFVAPASFESPLAPQAAALPAGTEFAPPAADPDLEAAAPIVATPIAGGYVVRPGDSWWSVAERAYGDGRLYRALFAWNRAAQPRLTLAPGTPLVIPPLEELAAVWPHLLPPRP